jgi:hypothetical protein
MHLDPRRADLETGTMGRVVVAAKIEPLGDALQVLGGSLSPDQVRTVEIPEAVIDTVATSLGLPRSMIDQLGLIPSRTARLERQPG